MTEKSLEIFIQIIIPILKINQEDRKNLIEDPSEFICMSMELCEDLESENLKTEAAKLLLGITQNVDGMLTFVIDFVLTLVEKVAGKSNLENQQYVNTII